MHKTPPLSAMQLQTKIGLSGEKTENVKRNAPLCYSVFSMSPADGSAMCLGNKVLCVQLNFSVPHGQALSWDSRPGKG